MARLRSQFAGRPEVHARQGGGTTVREVPPEGLRSWCQLHWDARAKAARL